MSKVKGRVAKSAVSGKVVKTSYAQHHPRSSAGDVEKFVKGFYEKNGKAMTQLAYE